MDLNFLNCSLALPINFESLGRTESLRMDRHRRMRKGGKGFGGVVRERKPLPLPFQNLDAALDEEPNRVLRFHFTVIVTHGRICVNHPMR